MDLVHFAWYLSGLWRASFAYGEYQTRGWNEIDVYEKGWFAWAFVYMFMLILKILQVGSRWY